MKRIAAIVVATLFAFPAWAGPGKAGLWDVTTQMNFGKGGPQIPPAQLEKMNQMGIDLPFGKPVVTKVCITPEMAAKDEPPKPMREKDGCEMKNYTRSGGAITADMVCNGEMKGDGKLKVSYDSNASYSGTMDFTGSAPHSGPVEMHNAFSGKWISENCGSVKPLATK